MHVDLEKEPGLPLCPIHVFPLCAILVLFCSQLSLNTVMLLSLYRFPFVRLGQETGCKE